MSETNGSNAQELMDAVVLLHAFPLDREMWNSVVPVLSRTHRVFALNLAGFGDGAAPPLDSLAAHANDIRARLAQHGVEKAHFVGCSLGGYVALAFAERYLDRVLSLTLVDSRTAPDSDTARAGRNTQIEGIRSNGHEAFVRALLPKLFAPTVDSAVLEHWIGRALNAGADALATTLAAMRDRTSTHETWRALRDRGAALHVVSGALDAVIPLAESTSIAQDVGATLDVIDSSGHLPPIEQPASFTAVLALRLNTLRVNQLEARALEYGTLDPRSIQLLLDDADTVRNALLLRNAELLAAESRDDAPEFVATTEQNQLLIKRCTVVVSDLRNALGLASRPNG